MRKEAKRGFQSFLESEKTIEAKNCEQQMQSCSWKTTEEGVDHTHTDNQIICSVFTSIDSSVMEDSDSSQSLSSSASALSSDLMEDATSFSSSSSSSSNGPLYQLSDLMAQLPIKRGLSKYYQGKSESFASLASVENLEDLAKKENPDRKRMKFSKFYSPKPTISKKTSYSRGCSSSSSTLARNTCTNFRSSCRLQDF